MPAALGKPVWPVGQDVTHPVQGLEVVLQRGAAKQPGLRDVGRAQTWLAPLAFDALDHGGLFAANVGTSAAPQLDARQGKRGVGLQGGQLACQQGTAVVVFIAQVDVDGLATDDMRSNQHAFQKTVGVTFKVIPVFEGAGFALVDVDRHQCGHALLAHLGFHNLPLAPRREACASQAAQACMLHALKDGIDVVLALVHRSSQCVPACSTVGIKRYQFRSILCFMDMPQGHF